MLKVNLLVLKYLSFLVEKLQMKVWFNRYLCIVTVYSLKNIKMVGSHTAVRHSSLLKKLLES